MCIVFVCIQDTLSSRLACRLHRPSALREQRYLAYKVFVCMRYVKKIGCHYSQSGVLKIEILILLRLARFQNLGTPLKNTLTSRAQAWPSSCDRKIKLHTSVLSTIGMFIQIVCKQCITLG